MSKENRVKINITMSKDIVDYYQKMAKSMGVPRSTCMVMGLKTFMDQQRMLTLTDHLPEIPTKPLSE